MSIQSRLARLQRQVGTEEESADSELLLTPEEIHRMRDDDLQELAAIAGKAKAAQKLDDADRARCSEIVRRTRAWIAGTWTQSEHGSPA